MLSSLSLEEHCQQLGRRLQRLGLSVSYPLVSVTLETCQFKLRFKLRYVGKEFEHQRYSRRVLRPVTCSVLPGLSSPHLFQQPIFDLNQNVAKRLCLAWPVLRD